MGTARQSHLLSRPVRLIPPSRPFWGRHGFPDRSGSVGLCHSCSRPVQETGRSEGPDHLSLGRGISTRVSARRLGAA